MNTTTHGVRRTLRLTLMAALLAGTALGGFGAANLTQAATGDAAAIIDRLETATKDLVALLRSQDAELSRLREQSEQFEKLREWMAKNA